MLPVLLHFREEVQGWRSGIFNEEKVVDYISLGNKAMITSLYLEYALLYRHHVNSSKNRPGAPLPPETSARVKLQSLDCAEGFDYINGW